MLSQPRKVFMSKNKYSDLKKINFLKIIKNQKKIKNLKCLIFGNFGAGNMGDEAILAGELNQLRKNKISNIFVVGKNTRLIKKIHKVNAINLYKLDKILRALLSSDLIIFGGGGIINKSDIKGFIYQIYILTIFLFIPSLFEKRIYLIGLGIYKNANKLIIGYFVSLLKKVEFISVRDRDSKVLLEEKGVSSSVFMDNSFLMDLLSKKAVLKNDFFSKKYDKNKKNIGVALVDPKDKELEKKILSEISKLVLSKKDTVFWFYYSYVNDKKFVDKIKISISKKFNDKFVYFDIPVDFGPKMFFSSFCLMDYFLASRFHAMVFAYRQKIKFSPFPYDLKCSQFLNSIK